MMSTFVFVCLFAVGQANPEVTRVASPVKGIVSEVAVQKGDRVAAGQILIRLDDRFARIELRLAEAKINLAQAELEVAKATAKEAEARVETKRALFTRNVVSKEELDAAVLMREKYTKELAGTMAQLEIARLSAERVRLVLDQHEIRAPAAGIVEEVLRSPGEGVHELETVVRIRRKQQ